MNNVFYLPGNNLVVLFFHISFGAVTLSFNLKNFLVDRTTYGIVTKLYTPQDSVNATSHFEF